MLEGFAMDIHSSLLVLSPNDVEKRFIMLARGGGGHGWDGGDGDAGENLSPGTGRILSRNQG
jgi:hypothetical protein